MAKVMVILADGFEETEALTPVDLLRRAGACVTVAGLGKMQIRGSHGIQVVCDAVFDTCADPADYDGVVLPGGMPGASNLAADCNVLAFIRKLNEKAALVAAICASPAVVLAPLGILDGRKAACYPGFESYGPKVEFTDRQVVSDKNIITARGAGCAVEFGLETVSYLFGREQADRLALSIIY